MTKCGWVRGVELSFLRSAVCASAHASAVYLPSLTVLFKKVENSNKQQYFNISLEQPIYIHFRK